MTGAGIAVEPAGVLTLHEFARRMPKAELHVHLEGAIRPATLLELARRNGVSLPAHDESELAEFYRFRDFAHFVEVYVKTTGCLQTPDDYRLVAYRFGSDCAEHNIRYAEVFFTISTNTRLTGLPWEVILEALNEGRAQAGAEFGVDWRWMLDISREQPQTQDAVIDIALAARSMGVIALGLGGPESEYPADLFQRAFERARRADLGRVPHAGEMAGPESVWAALRLLHADRIGHGVRAVESPELIEHLRLMQIPLDVCPTSNIRLGVYPGYAEHPVRRLWDAGLMITIGSDDPPMFGTDLDNEYRVLIDEFGFDRGELERVSLNAVRCSLLPESEKARLAATFEAEFAALRTE
jgi:adenosine deaminase